MRISKAFMDSLSALKLVEHGDCYEREYFPLIKNNFPEYEVFWRKFVVPATRRITDPPSKYFRDDIDPKIRQLCVHHYSLFKQLAYAHDHFQRRIPSSIYDIYAHLASAIEQAETLVDMCSELRNGLITGFHGDDLSGFSEDELLHDAKKWYSQDYDEYYRKCKLAGSLLPVKIKPSSKRPKNQNIGHFLSSVSFIKVQKEITWVRNPMIHAPEVARVTFDGQTYRILKHRLIDKYSGWDDALRAYNDRKLSIDDYTDEFSQAGDDIKRLEVELNLVWLKLINRLNTSTRSVHRSFYSYYNLQLFDEEQPGKETSIPYQMVLPSDDAAGSATVQMTSTYTSGSAGRFINGHEKTNGSE